MRTCACSSRLWPVGVTDVCRFLALQKLVAQMKQDPQVTNLTHNTYLTDRVWRGLRHLKITGLPDSSSDFICVCFQNADLKKQLHELQAKITALSEKQVCCLTHSLLSNRNQSGLRELFRL